MTIRLYLWKIERTDTAGYDEYSDAIVVAKTEQDARLIHPDGDGDPPEKWFENWGGWPVLPEQLKVTKVGTSTTDAKAGTVLCASFHAG